MDDFRPEALVQQIEPLRKLLEARVRLNDLLAKLQGNDELDAKLLEIVAATTSSSDQGRVETRADDAAGVRGRMPWPKQRPAPRATTELTEGGKLLEDILTGGNMVRSATRFRRSTPSISSASSSREVLTKDIDKAKVNEDAVASIQARIAEIDELIGEQLDEILHAKKVQALESRWRGLHYLVMNTETGTSLKIRVLNIKQSELAKDLESAAEFDRSALFKKVYEEEYGTFGGAPYGLLVGDYAFTGATPTSAS
jgi:hypothetical protein